MFAKNSVTIIFAAERRTAWTFAAAVDNRALGQRAANDLGLDSDLPVNGLMQGKDLQAGAPVRGSDLQVDGPMQGNGPRAAAAAATPSAMSVLAE